MSDDDRILDHDTAADVALRRLVAVLAASTLFALCFPPVLFAISLSTFLALGAGGIGTVALAAGDEVWADRPTRWDVAAVAYALSLLVGFFIDHGEVALFMLQQSAAP